MSQPPYPGLTDRALALRRVTGFSSVSTAELLAIAARMTVCAFAPGETLLGAGRVADRLLVCLDGAPSASGPDGRLVGLGGLLFGLKSQQEVVAGADGVVCLALDADNLYTAIRECPAILAEVVGQAAEREGGKP